jgi:hypothetical protein
MQIYGGIVPSFLTLTLRWRLVVSFTPWLLVRWKQKVKIIMMLKELGCEDGNVEM